MIEYIMLFIGLAKKVPLGTLDLKNPKNFLKSTTHYSSILRFVSVPESLP